MRHTAIFAVFFGLLASAATAEEVALVIGNGNYDQLRDVRRGGEVFRSAGSLKNAGVLVTSAEDADGRRLAAVTAEFAQVAARADGAVVVLSGRFVHSSVETYFLPSDSTGPGLAEVSGKALPLSVVQALLAKLPGRAVLLLASDQSAARVDSYLSEGIGQIRPAQGVTVFQADPSTAADFMESVLAVPEAAIVVQAQRMRGITVSGFMPEGLKFLRDEAGIAPAPKAGSDEEGYWNAIRDLDTAEAYELYIRRFPNGAHVGEARKAAADIRDEPNREARREEESLALSRNQRREIQRDLSLLDYNTRGIDGIFGKGTRAAVGAWQEKNGFDPTGYLTRAQITSLKAQSDRRAAELEAQAERRRIEQEREDRAYWRETGALGDEAGYRAYLKQYPDGRYAEIANARLRAIEDERRNSVGERERRFWDDVTAADTVEAYDAYLEQLPDGTFAEEARARREELIKEQKNSKAEEAAKNVEEQMRMNAGTRRVIEQRLNVLGLKPGPVDGTFDERTRRAIRRFQSERGLEVTGYLNESAVVRILAESILR